jgi:predicted nucleic acid-binding Zn ribbon protein
MSSEVEKELKKLYADRLKDKRQSRTKRRARIEAEPQSLSRIIPNYFTKNPKTLSKIEETRALISWEKYVGESAASQSQAVRLRHGTLTVKVSSPIWMQQLSFLKERILRHYRKDFPNLKITNIFFTR